jgi:hypothetical protein
MLSDQIEPSHTQLHDWANAWTAEIAGAVGGLDVSGWHHVRQIVHEIRRRAVARDLSHPKQPEPSQVDLPLLTEG